MVAQRVPGRGDRSAVTPARSAAARRRWVGAGGYGSKRPMSARFRFWLVLGALLILLIVVWVDVATQVWQNLTVLAGVVSGLVTFALTVLVIERVLAQSTHRRWAPVTRVALGDLLKTLVEESSELVHGVAIPRRLPVLSEKIAPAELGDAVVDVGREVVRERELLARSLASWSAYLVATAEVTDTLNDVAELVDRLDGIHDTLVELRAALAPTSAPAASAEERAPDDVAEGAATMILTARLADECAGYDDAVASIVARLVHALDVTFRPVFDRVERGARVRRAARVEGAGRGGDRASPRRRRARSRWRRRACRATPTR